MKRFITILNMGAFKVDARCFIYFFSKLFLDPVEFLEIQNVNVNFFIFLT